MSAINNDYDSRFQEYGFSELPPNKFQTLKNGKQQRENYSELRQTSHIGAVEHRYSEWLIIGPQLYLPPLIWTSNCKKGSDPTQTLSRSLVFYFPCQKVQKLTQFVHSPGKVWIYCVKHKTHWPYQSGTRDFFRTSLCWHTYFSICENYFCIRVSSSFWLFEKETEVWERLRKLEIACPAPLHTIMMIYAKFMVFS